MCRSAQLQLVKRMLMLPDPRTAATLLAAAWLLSGSRAQPTTWSQDEDWLVHRPVEPSRLVEDEAAGTLTLTNGLVSRAFSVVPDFATLDLRHEVTGQHFVRAIGPEAIIGLRDASDEQGRVVNVSVGGLLGQREPALLFRSPWEAVGGEAGLQADPQAFHYVTHSTAPPEPRFQWHPQRHSDKAPWPPKGLRLRVDFKPPASSCSFYCHVVVSVVYELYDGLPLLSKWVEVTNGYDARAEVVVASLVSERVRVPEHAPGRLLVETDYMPRKTFWAHADGLSTLTKGPYAHKYMNYEHWGVDGPYQDNGQDRALQGDAAFPRLLLEVRYPLGPDQPVKPQDTHVFFRVLVLLLDSEDEERRGLARRRMLRTLAPQVTESLLYFYSTDASSQGIRRAAQQAASVGFEALLLSYGSGFDPSSDNTTYIQQIKEDFAFVHGLGLRVGGYTLMQSNGAQGLKPEDQCVDPDGGGLTGIAHFATPAHRQYQQRLLAFISQTGMDMLEADGPYEGAACAKTANDWSFSQANSQPSQVAPVHDFFRQLKLQDLFLTVPDPYNLAAGTNRQPMGYTDEWTHVKDFHEYLTLGRLYLYDATYHLPPSMGWMGLELARIEPLQDHLSELEWGVAQYLGQGNIPCFRGPQVTFGSQPVARVWRRWLSFYKRHRAVLNADVIHVQRPNGWDLELSLHALLPPPSGPPPPEDQPLALGLLVNPSNRTVLWGREGRRRPLVLPLYYAGVRPGQRLRLEWHGVEGRPGLAASLPAASVVVVGPDYSVRLQAQHLRRLDGPLLAFFTLSSALGPEDQRQQ